MSDRPQADYVGHPAMDDGSYRIDYSGPYQRLGFEGIWWKYMEYWTENGRECGIWRWTRTRFEGETK